MVAGRHPTDTHTIDRHTVLILQSFSSIKESLLGDELDETSFPSFDYGVTQVEVSSSMIMVRFFREVRRWVGLGRPP